MTVFSFKMTLFDQTNITSYQVLSLLVLVQLEFVKSITVDCTGSGTEICFGKKSFGGSCIQKNRNSERTQTTVSERVQSPRV